MRTKSKTTPQSPSTTKLNKRKLEMLDEGTITISLEGNTVKVPLKKRVHATGSLGYIASFQVGTQSGHRFQVNAFITLIGSKREV